MMKAKDASLLAKILAAAVLVIAHVLMWMGILKGADSKSICLCAFSIMGIFGTIDINLMLEKFSKVNFNND